MKRFLKNPIILLLASSHLFSSCASILSRSSYPVYIHTNPSGVNVSITNKKGIEVFKGLTPTTVKLKTGSGYFAKAEYQVKLSSPGLSEKVVPINYKLNGWYFGNLLLGGVIGMLVVDPATGAMWKVSDPVVDETLVGATAANKTEPTLNIVNINDVSEKEKSKLTKIN